MFWEQRFHFFLSFLSETKEQECHIEQKQAEIYGGHNALDSYSFTTYKQFCS